MSLFVLQVIVYFFLLCFLCSFTIFSKHLYPFTVVIQVGNMIQNYFLDQYFITFEKIYNFHRFAEIQFLYLFCFSFLMVLLFTQIKPCQQQ